jgi:hypothetical protein
VLAICQQGRRRVLELKPKVAQLPVFERVPVEERRRYCRDRCRMFGHKDAGRVTGEGDPWRRVARGECSQHQSVTLITAAAVVNAGTKVAHSLGSAKACRRMLKKLVGREAIGPDFAVIAISRVKRHPAHVQALREMSRNMPSLMNSNSKVVCFQ